MSGDRTDPPAVRGEPLGTTDPTWRDEQPAGDEGRGTDDEAERTIDADPAWLARLTDDDAPDLAGAGDSERTIDVDPDLLEHVRAVARAARDALAAPPETSATDGEPDSPTAPPAVTGDEPNETGPGAAAPTATATDQPDRPSPAAATGGQPWSPPPPDGATSWLLAAVEPGPHRPPTPAAAPPVTAVPPADPAVTPAAAPPVRAVPPADPALTPGGGRWQPPARLRPVELRPSDPLLAAPAPSRRHLDWRWAALGIVLAALVGFLIAIAVRGGDDTPDPAPGSTTAPGATTTVSTP